MQQQQQQQLDVQTALSLLKLRPGATRKQIRASYKRLALQLHPDKQHATTRHTLPPPPAAAAGGGGGHAAHGPAATTSSSTNDGAAFALLSAAYSLLMQGSSRHDAGQQQHQPQQQQQEWAPFETAYATGSLFSEQLVDEAVRAGAAPLEIHTLHQLSQAAACGRLAEHLAEHAPAPQDEQLWRQLYGRLELQAQARQLPREQQQQPVSQAGGVGLAELLSDLLLRPSGPLLVPDSDSELEFSDEEEQAAGVPRLQHHQQIGGAGPPSQQLQQQQPHAACPQAADDPRHDTSKQQQRLRHGWGWYWMWLRRALLVKALLSLAVGGARTQQALEHKWPQPLPDVAVTHGVHDYE